MIQFIHKSNSKTVKRPSKLMGVSLSTGMCSFDTRLLHCKIDVVRREVCQFRKEIIGGMAVTWSECACGNRMCAPEGM